jgi:phospholipid/cholesterol/gamma-HCH transport system substrate-binding protein
MGTQRSLEIKVGALILVGVVLLAGLILVMGGIHFGKRFSIAVDFNNPGGIQPGAPVKIAGVRVGTIDRLEFRGARVDPATGRASLVRVHADIDERYRAEIHSDAEFFVTTQGVLGEQFLAIDPGSAAQPLLQFDHPVEGIDPPRIDLFVARAYALLDDTVTAIRSNRRELGGMVDDLAGVLHNTNDILHRNQTRVDTILEGVDRTVHDTDSLVNAARDRYVDGAQARRIVNRLESVLASIERDVPPLTRDARALTTRLNHIAQGVGGDEQIRDIQSAIRDVRALSARANAMAGDAQTITTRVRSGQGTVGALLMDEELYDDLQEMVRDLKHNPWKFFWRE